MVQSGEIAWFVFSRSVIPAGETAMCDYVGATATRGFPSEPVQARLAQAVAKAGTNMTADQYLAKVNSLRRQVTSSMLVTLAAVGEIGEGDYYRVNYMKLKPGGGWNELEQKIWRPVQEQRVKEGKLKAWRTYTRMLPGGSGHPYDAVTIDVFPSWAAQGQAGRTGRRDQEGASYYATAGVCSENNRRAGLGERRTASSDHCDRRYQNISWHPGYRRAQSWSADSRATDPPMERQ